MRPIATDVTHSVVCLSLCLEPIEKPFGELIRISISRFCTAHTCDQHTERQTDKQTMLRATSVTICHTYVLRACDAMRPDNKSASPRHLLKTFSLLDCSNVRESYKIGIELNLIEGLSGCAHEFCTTSLNTSYSNCLFENCTTIIITIITLLCTRQ